VNNKSSHLGW